MVEGEIGIGSFGSADCAVSGVLLIIAEASAKKVNNSSSDSTLFGPNWSMHESMILFMEPTFLSKTPPK